MRIAVSNPRRGWGGAASMALLLTEGLAARGHETVLLCRPGSALHGTAEGRVPCAPVLRGADFPPPAILRARDVLRRHASQAVVCATAQDLRLTGIAARLSRIPVVARRVHQSPAVARPAASWFWRRIPTHIVANSASTREDFLASAPWCPPERVTVVHNGLDIERFRATAPVGRAALGLPPAAPVLGFVGRLDAEKGVRELAEAWRRIAPRLGDVHLLVVGGGGAERELEETLAASGRVRMLGHRDDVPALLPVMDVVLVPSLSEAFGLAALEAMAAGVPVVASRTGGLVELVRDGETGFLVPPGDAAALALAAERLLASSELREELGAAAARRAELFTLDRTLDGYEAVLEAAIAPGRTGRADRRPAGRTA